MTKNQNIICNIAIGKLVSGPTMMEHLYKILIQTKIYKCRIWFLINDIEPRTAA
jgi:hypothetical protein